MEQKGRLAEVAGLFLKLGFTAFGGPAAHIAMMQQEIVERRRWMSEQHFLDLLGATHLIPGPNSTEMAIHIGYDQAGWKGLLAAGLCFILPAVFITGVLAFFYQQYGQLPEAQPWVYGIKPAILAVVLGAVYPLARKSLKSRALGLIGAAVLLLSLLGCPEIYLLFGAGFLAWAWQSAGAFRASRRFAPLVLLQVSAPALLPASPATLFWIFLKIGAILYGSGYVLFAFLDTELVARGLLSRQQLMDAIAAGQLTPGPVFSSVTFIGYQIGGWAGAAVSTLGVFLPSFAFVALLGPLLRQVRSSAAFGAFLDAVNVASVALILSVCWDLGRESLYDWRTGLIAAAGLLLSFAFRKINSAWLVLGGSLAGYLLSWV